jgi:hypothetical protein
MCGIQPLSRLSSIVILRRDRRIQNALPGVKKTAFIQPLERLLDGPVRPDHDVR